eukprot:4334900-Karenia_brevis.AAC.1
MHLPPTPSLLSPGLLVSKAAPTACHNAKGLNPCNLQLLDRLDSDEASLVAVPHFPHMRPEKQKYSTKNRSNID